MTTYIKSFKGFLAESIESNTKEIQLLDQKKALQEKLTQSNDPVEKTSIETEIAKLDIEIEKIREIENQEAGQNV
jgi:hypothetical protein